MPEHWPPPPARVSGRTTLPPPALAPPPPSPPPPLVVGARPGWVPVGAAPPGWQPVGAPWMAAAPVRQPDAPFGTLPVRAAVLAGGITVLVLLANRVLIRLLARLEWPIAVYVTISAVIAYGPLVWMCRSISRRFGTGSMKADLGLELRPVDLGWGVVTWLLTVAVQFATAFVVLITRIPIASNTKGIDASGGERGYVISLLVVAVVAAPIVEEMVFRGVVLRGLASRLPIVAAIAVQGLLFGAVHIDPMYGWGNIGLVMVLSAVGATFGAMALVVRRLAPTMIAHGILNAIALTIALTGVLN